MSIAQRTTMTQVLLDQPPKHQEASKMQNEPPLCLTQHSVMQITLNGPALIVTIIGLIISIHLLQPSMTCTILALSPLPWIINNDYENFLALGPGGTPSTFLGYLKINYLRLFALSDPYKPAPILEKLHPPTGYHQSHQWLPRRQGPRPTIAGIAPQRQLNQPGSFEIHQALRKTLENVAAKNPAFLRVGTSCFEKKGLALFARCPINATCRGEICHVHHSDRSLHLNLHPEDAKVVLENGWGERHPLARGGWMKAYVPREFVMVYAPRDEVELEVVCRIVEAAGFWVSGEGFAITEEKEEVLRMRKAGTRTLPGIGI